MVFTVSLGKVTKEDITCKKKLDKLVRENNVTITFFLHFLVDQAYELEYPSKGRDYKEWIKEWREKNGWKAKGK